MRYWLYWFLLGAGATLAMAAPVISPTGSAYLSVTASSQYSSSFGPLNLFNIDVTGLLPGSPTGSTVDWAVRGTAPAYVEFELDASYEISSVFYAQRVGAVPNLDKVDHISIWARDSAPFSAADPGIAPVQTLTITNKQSAIWAEYQLTRPISGRYVLLRFDQDPVVGGNIGGNELRLGGARPDHSAPVIAFVYPEPGKTLRQLSTIEVNFSEPVAGVDPADLRINGVPASAVTSLGSIQYLFSLSSLPPGPVAVTWSDDHGIRDLSSNSNAFAATSWTYTFAPQNPMPTNIIISEFLASNSGTRTNSLRDELGNAPDWIELFNPTADAINLAGWFLTDNSDKPGKWSFPATTLASGQYLVVFASGRNANVNGQLHTSFKISASGGYLGLHDPASNVVSSFSPYPPQTPDVSFGRERVDPTQTRYFEVTTPGAPNADGGTGAAPEVQFSRSSRTFKEPFLLTLETDNPDCEIRYLLVRTNVLQGNPAVVHLPDASSPKYEGPITIDASMQVLARAFSGQPGILPGPVSGSSFIKISPGAAGFHSDLPIILMESLGGGEIPHDYDQQFIVMVFEPTNGLASLTNLPTLATSAGVNVRGRTTASFPKSSFSVEVWDESNDDRDVPFCGMPEESDWVLYAPNCFDIPLMHNPLMHQLGREMGYYAPRTRFAEVFLNTGGGAVSFSAPAGGDYNGIYVVEEKIKRDANRVNISSLDPAASSEPEITGGYLLKFDEADPDEFTFSAGGIVSPDSTFIYEYPDGQEMAGGLRLAQNQYLTNYLNALASALHSPDWTNPATGYARYLDVNAAIDHHLINVLALNVDAFRLSSYMHKPRGGKLVLGPQWDFDRALGTSRGDNRAFNPRSWRGIDYDFSTDFFNPSAYYNNAWYSRLFHDPDFWQRYIDRYQQLRVGLWSTTNLFAVVDGFANEVAAAHAREVARWGGSGASDTSPRSGIVSANGYTFDFGSVGSYQGEINFLKTWLADRLNFMDTNFVACPQLGIASGFVTNPLLLSVTGPPGAAMYYTLDGTDPRAPGGTIAPGARTYAGAIELTNNATLLVRAFDPHHSNLIGPHNPPISSSWSGLAEGIYLLNRPVIESRASGEQLILGFQAWAHCSYTLEVSQELGGQWLPLASFAARSTNHLVSTTDNLASSKRFYRLQTSFSFQNNTTKSP